MFTLLQLLSSVRSCTIVSSWSMFSNLKKKNLRFTTQVQHWRYSSLYRPYCWGCIATHSPLFIAACQHDQSLYILLPDHPPEIFDCGRQRTLSCNKLLLGVVTLPNTTTSPTTQTQASSQFSFSGGSSAFSNMDVDDGREKVGLE